MKKVILAIDGMTCSACSSGLEKYLNKQDGIKEASVNLVMNTVNIEYDEKILKLDDLERFVKNAGFKSLGINKFEKEQRKDSKKKYKLIGISVLSIINLYISMSHMIGLPNIPYLDMANYPFNYSICLFIITSLVLILGFDILRNGFKNLIHKTPNMDTLVTIGVLSSYLYSLYGTLMIIGGKLDFVGKLYFESASTVLFFIEIGKYIENKNKEKTKEALQKLMTITPKSATILKDGAEYNVTLDEIKKGDIVMCKPGEKIAVDGTIIYGSTHIEESFITGESTPVKRSIGSNVLAGSINYEGSIRYKAERIGKESTVSEIVREVHNATSTKAPIAKIADKISSFFVPVIVAIAITAFTIWYIITRDFSFSINIFVTTLVIACPCSLGLATPLAIVIASGLCSERGILVKSSVTLENAHKIKTIAFDKTGTLTKGTLNISKVFNYSTENDDDIIKRVASIESKSEHPIAQAFSAYVKEKIVQIEDVQDFKSISGLGVYAKIQSDEYYIGNRKLMIEKEIEIPKEQDEIELSETGNSILFVSKNGQLIALIGVRDVIRDNIKDVIKKLKNSNIDIMMLTGDNEKTAKFIADEIGIEKIIANVKPNEKAEKIEELKKNGIVAMCGDGINDSVSLITSDIGISISNGTDIARDSASVILMNGNLDKVNDLIYISRKTVRIIKQNLFWAFFYNILMIPIAVGMLSRFNILLNPMIASLSMTLSSLTVVLNTLRLNKIVRKV